MSVAELIAELQRYPQGASVRVCIRSIHLADESGDWTQSLTEEDAQPVDEVRLGGAFVMVWGGRE